MGPFYHWRTPTTSCTESRCTHGKLAHRLTRCRRAFANTATGRHRTGAGRGAVPLGRLLAAAVGALTLLLALAVTAPTAVAADPCAPPVTNAIACENTKPGNPSTEWQISGAGSSTIQGFATSMSVNPGDTVRFKIKTPATRYHIDIYRMGYYGGNGARKVASALQPSATLPQAQPACLSESTATGLVDCGNWAVSASWAVPSTAVSGVYFARLVRDDTSGTSQIVFVVKNDSGSSEIIVQTSDQTWQAYNTYGGNSLYTCTSNCPPGSPAAYKGASKVSYNRPFNTAVDSSPSWLMSAEYPMIRFLEANGYDVSYTSGVDVGTSTGGSLLTSHKLFLSVGHDEYWSGQQRANVEAARDAGVNLAFFSGNEVFWKTRFETSIDGTSAVNRTLVSYKETHYDGPVDPQDPPTWTGTWQDPRFSPPADGGRPQNALTGQLFAVNSGSTDIQVPAQYGKLRFWRDTAAATLGAGQTLTLAPGQQALGYEWDVDPDNGFRPAGLFNLSSTTYTQAEMFTDYGSTVQTGSTATHRMSLYRAPSGALVFGAGTVQWSWGLDDPGSTPDRNMRQATVNLFADMGVQPYALGYPGLTLATRGTDTSAPTSTITSPAGGTSVGDGTAMTISGTASDTGGGVVAGVEVSTDGGDTWHPAVGTTSWSYSWVAHGNPSTTIRTRAVDDSGNLETPSAGRPVDVGCTCSIWGTASTPRLSDSGSATAVEVGVKFRSDVSGKVTGVRFYKSSRNTGTHVGNLWTASGTKLASVTFTNESATGWQQATFSAPVAINANTTYVVSYFAPAGHTARDAYYLFPNPSPRPDAYSHVDSPPLHALRNTNGMVNGFFRNGSTSAFPTDSEDAANYWVDVMFTLNTGPASVPGAPTVVQATPGNASAVVTWAAPPDGGSAITGYTVTPYIGSTAQPAKTITGNPPGTSTTVTGLTNGTAYTFRVEATNAVGTGLPSTESNAVLPAAASCSACTLWPSSTVPSTLDQGDPNSIEVGVKFRADLNGEIKGLRFYKGTANTGTHIGNLWTSTGTKLASVTFTNESATGWQQATFSTPVAITAGTLYVASYFAPNGHYPVDGGYFAGKGVDAGLLHAPADGVNGGQGVYRYGTSSGFPTSTFNSENYWVDVVYATGTPTAPNPPGTPVATAGDGSAVVSWTAPADGGSPITSYTVTPYIGTTAQTAKTVTGSPPATSTTVTGLTNGTAYTFKITATNAIGTGAASASSNTVTPAGPTAPAAPTGVTATAGDGSAQISWTAPSNGGNPITSYTVTPYIGTTAQTAKTVTGTTPATSTTVTGLTNGTAYTFTVTATNAIGTGAASASSNTVTPAGPTAPAAPTGVTATAGDGSAQISWTAPSNGGSPITSYTVTPYIGTTAQTAITVTGTTPATSTTVTGLTNGTAYTFTVTATNAIGTGPASTPSTAVTPTAGGCSACTIWPSTVTPTTPSNTDSSSVELGVKFTSEVNGQVTGIRFYKGSANTGTHIGNLWTSTGTKLASVTFTNESATGWQQATFSTPVAITAGTVYVASYLAPVGGYASDSGYFTIGMDRPPLHALSTTDAGGNGVYAYSTTSTFPTNTWNSTNYWVDVVFASGPVAPPVTPAAPTGVTATAGDGSAQVSWTAPSNGGSPITSYTVTPYIGTTAQTAITVTGSPPATSTTVTGLTNGTAYTFKITATNAIGTGPTSTPSTAVTPAAGAVAPGAPTGVTASAGDGSALVSWTAPSNGGSPITSYTVTPYIGTTAQTAKTVTGSPPGTSTTVTGLTNGTAYTFTVTATNAVGTGPASTPSTAVTPTGAPTAPAAPAAVTATAGDGSALVSWSAPSNGGNPITSYTVTPYIGGTAQTATTVTGTTPATSTTVTGLTNGTAYTFTVTATNAIGTGPASTPSTAVTPTAGGCSACTIWPSTVTPTTPSNTDSSSVELGVKFTSEVNGQVTGIRFYKGSANTGTHIGNLWTSTGTKLASVTFTNESATGWQQATFSTPVAITAGTVYVASYLAPVGGYAADSGYFTTGMDRAPLHALSDVDAGGNGVYAYGTTSTFPTNTWNSTNYWVDVVFASGPVAPPTTPGAPTGVTTTAGDGSAQVSWTAPSNGGSPITSYTVTPYIGTTAQTAITVTGSPPATSTTVTGLTNGTAYTFTVTATNAVGTGPTSTPSTAVTPTAGGCSTCTIWPSTAVPTKPSVTDTSSVELGVKFTSDVNGQVTGIRFYKGSANRGTHVGNLWTSTGTNLASVTFTNESATGWQQATFSTPVAITAGTVYVASYLAPVGRYAGDSNYFNNAAVDNPPLHALKSSQTGGNGVYAYGSTSTFPASTFKAANYWVDVVFARN